METTDEFGSMLIEALEEAVAYKRGELPALRVTRYEIIRGKAGWGTEIQRKARDTEE